ncbi:MAG: hypothetical protein JO227_24575 [Acetobacteraceae bacterium]|nr:hypothetical protein [Acetobacteraceae bacterium]
MALWAEEQGSKLLAAAALGAGALLLTRLMPNLRSVAISGLKLFAEAEFGMEDGLIGGLAERAVDALLDSMQAPEPDAAVQANARKIINRFERTARRRSQRKGWHERDRAARYHHHLRKLKAAIAKASRDLPEDQRQHLATISSGISEDW